MSKTLANLSAFDRALRLGVGTMLMATGWLTVGFGASSGPDSLWLAALRILSLYPLLTGALAWCPIKSLIPLLRSPESTEEPQG